MKLRCKDNSQFCALLVLRESQVQVPLCAPIKVVENKRFAASYGFIDTSVNNTGVFFMGKLSNAVDRKHFGGRIKVEGTNLLGEPI